MSKLWILAVACAMAPMTVAAATMTEAEIIALAVEKGTCGDLQPISAKLDANGAATVQCAEAEGFVPLLGGLGAGAGAVAAGMAALALGVGGAGDGAASTTTTTTR